MNPLTQIKNTQKATKTEIELGISDKSSWHARFKHSAYVFSGGLPYELTEGDLLAVFSQYGEIVDVHLVRDKQTGKSKGFAFLAYEDQRSTVLAVDNLSGARVAGRTIRVEHVDNYRRKRAEVEGDPVPSDAEDDGGDAPEARGGARHHADDGHAQVMQSGREGADHDAAPGPSGGGSGEGEDAPWAGGGSVFGMLAAARQKGIHRPWAAKPGGEATARESGPDEGRRERDGKGKKDKKAKKEKKEKKDKHRKGEREDGEYRSRSRSRSREHRRRSWSRERGGERCRRRSYSPDRRR